MTVKGFPVAKKCLRPKSAPLYYSNYIAMQLNNDPLTR